MGAALGIPAAAQAADFTVTNLNDAGPGSLRQAALDAVANPGHDRVVFASGLSGEIDLTSGEIVVNDTDVVGPGPGQITVKQTAALRVFHATPVTGGSVSMSGLTVTGGNVTGKGGGIFVYNEDLNLTNMVVTGNKASTKGGGVALYQGGANVKDTTVTGNQATAGSGMFFYGGLSMTNTANDGGGWHVTNTVVSGNTTTTSRGGAIKFYRAIHPLDVIDTTVSGNTGGRSGGGITFYKTAVTNIVDSTHH